MTASQSPGAHLVDFYRGVLATSMAGLPFLNPQLDVEAVGFRPWQGGWLGIVITPWFINLFLLPAANAVARAPGSRREVVFPAARLGFIADRDEAVGDYESCPLFAPVREFAGQDQARQAAFEALDALFASPVAEVPAGAGPTVGESRRSFLRRVMPGRS